MPRLTSNTPAIRRAPPVTARRVSLAAHCAEVIRSGCRQGRWTEYLPSERNLSAELHVSRMTLRAALTQLCRDGVLEVAHGCRTRIVSARQSARTEVSPTIGFVTPKPLTQLRPFVTLWIDYLRSELQESGFTLRVHEGERYYQTDPSLTLRELVRHTPHAGWIFYLTNRRIQQWVAAEKLPAVVIGYRFPELKLPFVAADIRAVCRHAAQRMLALGHRRIVFLKRSNFGLGDVYSEQGFLEAFSGPDGLKASPEVMCPGGANADLVPFMARLMATKSPPTAILVGRTSWFFTIFSYLLSTGVRIPERVSLVARDDEAFFAHLHPAATRYSFSAKTFGRKVANVVSAVVNGNVLPQQHFPILPSFVPGGTLGRGPFFNERVLRLAAP